MTTKHKKEVSIDYLFKLKKSTAKIEKELNDIDELIEEYKSGNYDLQGIRIFSRLHTSIDLDLNILDVSELLGIYKSRLQSKYKTLQDELNNAVEAFKGNDVAVK